MKKAVNVVNSTKYINSLIENDDENAGDDEILPLPTFSIDGFHKLVESYWTNGLHGDLSKNKSETSTIQDGF